MGDSPVETTSGASASAALPNPCLVRATQPSFPSEEDTDALGFGPLQYHCDACQKDISDVFRVRCAACVDFDLCVDCFASGIETGTHRNDHPYIPIGRNDLALFTPDWNADEEMMLLEGVSKFGFGNWAEVADLVEPYNAVAKKKEECEQHYYDVHIAPYRTPAVAEHVTQRFGENQTPDLSNPLHRQLLQKEMIGKAHPPLPEPLRVSPGSSACKIVGFMPLRGDFDVEYDNDAELILSDIEFRGDETPQERELKLKIIDIYNAKLDERVLRKRVVIESGLADWRRVQQLGKKRSKEEADLHNLFRLLVRFNMTPDPEELVQLLLTERKVRQRIHTLQEWMSLGIETFEEAEEYECNKLSTISGLGFSNALPRKTKLSGVGNSKKVAQPPGSCLDTTAPQATATKTASSSTSIEDPPIFSENDSASSTALASGNSGKGMNRLALEAPASQYPGAQLLTEQELNFCDQIQLPPIYFLFAKHTLLNVLSTNTDPDKLNALDVLRLDATKTGTLHDFILHASFDLPRPCPPNIDSNTCPTPNQSNSTPQ